MGNIFQQGFLGFVLPIQVGDARPAAAPGADRPAIGGKPANLRLQVDGDEVGNQQRPVQSILVRSQLLGVFNHWERSGKPLVPAARDNDHRQAAAVHPGVGPGGSHGLGPDLHIVPIGGEQHLADIGAVIPPQALLGDGGIKADLPGKGLLHI